VGDGATTGLDAGALLQAAEDAAPVDAADVIGAQLYRSLGATEVAFLIADLSGEALQRLSHVGDPAATRTQATETAERVPLRDSAAGRALRDQALHVAEVAGGCRVHAPVTNRGEAIGVLEVTLPGVPGDEQLADVRLAAHVLAYVVIANRRFTDLFEWGRRSLRLSLAAEIQHRLLPSASTCEAGQFTVAGWLEPAGEIAGDTFDFSVDRDVLHLSMTDAMGHAVRAAVLASVLVGALRNGRRADLPLGEQARRASDALHDHSGGSEFVTGQVARIDLDSGTTTIVNAGHPAPLRLRGGRVEAIELQADPPFGTLPGQPYRVQTLQLEPGDRLMFVTDGVLERNAASIDLAMLMVQTAAMHPRETVQDIVHALLAETKGRLMDDATILCLDWHGGERRDRDTRAGANV
jgi:serine phosphatase RsbU (regulator of sigma subunit)